MRLLLDTHTFLWAIPWAEQSGLEFLPIGLSHLLALEQRPLHPAQCR